MDFTLSDALLRTDGAYSAVLGTDLLIRERLLERLSQENSCVISRPFGLRGSVAGAAAGCKCDSALEICRIGLETHAR